MPASAGHEAGIRAGRLWYALTSCNGAICARPAQAPDEIGPTPRPHGALPDGGIARHGGNGIARAWYGEPTRAYSHGVLGDAIEANTLLAEDISGKRYQARAGKGFVFEDITPRLADLDGDGAAEAIAILTDTSAGASLAVFGLRGGQLRKLAATAPLGRPNRWLNVAGIADFDGDGRTEIAIVTTPHIGGTLEFWSYENGQDGAPAQLVRVAALPGFSNHAIGSRNLSLSAVLDANGDGFPDLALPDANRSALRILTLSGGTLTELIRINLPGILAHNIVAVETAGGTALVGALSGGATFAISRD